MKILYTATVVSHICQFHLPYMQELQARGHEIHVAAYDNLKEKQGLALKYTDQFTEVPFRRSPLDWHNIHAYRSLKKLIQEQNYGLILCSTPVGGILTRLAARKARKKGCKVVYMAHGFHFYRGAPKKNWLLYYPLERFMAQLCDLLIVVSWEDYALARNKFRAEVGHIHGIGASAERYGPVQPEEQAAMRWKLRLAETDFVLLCTGELNKNKDQKTLIRAAAALREEIPELKILFAGNGPLEQGLKELVLQLEQQNRVQFLGYRSNLERVVPCVDAVISCSHREGLPLNVVEAMLCGKPLVAAENRGTRELVRHGENGLLFAPGDAQALAEYIRMLRDPKIREEMGRRGMHMAKQYTQASVRQELLPMLEHVMEE